MAHHYGEYLEKAPTIVVSGGFDPIHIGHVRMFKAASRHGILIVVLNSDEWLQRKKGHAFMPYDERKEIIESIRGVSAVIQAEDADGTVCETLRALKPTYFANGGDRVRTNTPEMSVCEEMGIQMVWNVGGDKIQSSSELIEQSKTSKRRKAGGVQTEAQQLDLFELNERYFIGE